MGFVSQLLGASLLALAAGSSLAQAPAPVKNVVLVHGLYADGSSWAQVIPLLQKAGLNVTAVQNPTTSLADDVEATRRALAQQDGPTVLVGHSYGGMVISEAGADAKVAALVYVAARAPDAGEDYPALAKTFPAAPAGKGLVWSSDGFGKLSEEAFVKDFAGDLDPHLARVYYAAQQPVARAVTTAKTTVAAWRSKPSWYVVSRQDRTIDPDFQRFMAKRMGAKTTEVDASHVSMISKPEDIARVILAATQAR
ncbi:alpha/beta fold hydrolase [Roseateles sp. NT4]|uniref:alpha/beta fold hydrolase n=1 Tax=Roseateles sp. NT4 TaxID=3453715 RepID=UPI003EE9752C